MVDAWLGSRRRDRRTILPLKKTVIDNKLTFLSSNRLTLSRPALPLNQPAWHVQHQSAQVKRFTVTVLYMVLLSYEASDCCSIQNDFSNLKNLWERA